MQNNKIIRNADSEQSTNIHINNSMIRIAPLHITLFVTDSVQTEGYAQS